MRFKKVLLLHPPVMGSGDGTFDYDYVPLPVGLGYISEALLQNKIENKVIDLRFGYSFEHIVQQVANYKPNLIGMSLYSFLYRETYRFIENIKARYEDVPIVVGGPHVSVCMEKVLRDCGSIDYGVVREGEETIVELCEGENAIEEIKGLIHRTGTSIKFTGYRVLNKDIDNIPFPKYASFELTKYTGYGFAVPFITSRGCGYDCNFCIVNSLSGKRFRFRSASSIIEEMEYWYNKGIRYFSVGDDNFVNIKSRVYELCKKLKERKLKHINIDLTNGIRADHVNEDILRKLKQIGVTAVSFGVESANDRVLKIINKRERMATIDKAVSLACNLGFYVFLYFILGTPGETEEDVNRSIDFGLKYPVLDARMYNLIPLPGTALYDWVDKNNKFMMNVDDMLNTIPHWENMPVFETDELPYKKRQILHAKANSVFKRHTEYKASKHRRMLKRFRTATAISSAYSHLLPYCICYLLSIIHCDAWIPKWLSRCAPLSLKIYLTNSWRNLVRI